MIFHNAHIFVDGSFRHGAFRVENPYINREAIDS